MALFFYKEKNKDIRAAAYLRLSIEDGDKAESNSIGNQRELIRDFAAERPGLHLVEEYADDGYTGTNFERPGFKRMMEDIKSGKINCIIVKDLSRLGRNYIEMGKYLEQIFPMMGIRFIAINDNYDNTLVWERALSLRNPWIQQMAQYKTPEELDRNFVKKYIEQVTVILRDDGQAEISLTMKTDEWKQMLSRIEVEGTDSGTKE